MRTAPAENANHAPYDDGAMLRPQQGITILGNGGLHTRHAPAGLASGPDIAGSVYADNSQV